MNNHNLELLRSDLGDGGWSLHDPVGKLLIDGPAEMIDGDWDRPNQADYDRAAEMATPRLVIIPQGGCQFHATLTGEDARILGTFIYGELDDEDQYVGEDEDIIAAAREEFGVDASIAAKIIG